MSLSRNPQTRTISSLMLSNSCWCLCSLILLGISFPLRVSGNESYSNVTHEDFGKGLSNGDCSEKSLEEQEERASIIFTGTVQAVTTVTLNRKHLHSGQSRVHVEVKRILKGRLPEEGNTVDVDGLDNPEICHSSANQFDTRIFLVNEVDHVLKLNSSLIRLTLNNLEHVEAAVKNDKFVRKPKDPEDPCAVSFCPFHAQCAINASTGGPYCSCPKSCHGVFTPVCGSDNVTYASKCHLRMASCQQQKAIRAKSPGSCSDPDVCVDTQCGFGAVCVPSSDGSGARCECSDNCSRQKRIPICGSDGKDYGNLCEMEKASCIQMQNISRKYDGKCDPCQGFNCTFGVCHVNARREAVCRCDEIQCTRDLEFICASDGKTYDNECAMRREACASRRKITKVFAGKCPQDFNPCHGLRCKPHSECQVNNARRECACPGTCESSFRPVCGDDGKTYDNECQLRRHSCISDVAIAVKYEGFCAEKSPCSRVWCAGGMICRMINGQPSCICPTCAQEFNPVCGSNGISYSSQCILNAESCQRRENIAVERKGLCSSCEKRCAFYAECQLDSHNVAQCVCPTFCVQVENQVCGTDGVTYTNECELRIASCSSRKSIVIASEGSCDMCANIKCRRGARCERGKCVCPRLCPETNAPVCASNGNTYANECVMRQSGCQMAIDLEVVQSGECDYQSDQSGSGSGVGEEDGESDGCQESTCLFGGVCAVDSSGSEECRCSFTCPALRQTVCGSDGRTYGSECLMREMSCKMQKEIVEQSVDNCEDILEELCEGTVKLIDPVTKKDYNCSGGWEVCPAGSYCHKTTAGAKCCQEDTPISSCWDTAFGCCADNATAAPGPLQHGCPGFCNCNPLGSLSSTCDPTSRQCTCKPGVAGLKCDQCHPGYWRLPSNKENSGCLACDCSPVGSLRDDCDQWTGRCLCRQGFTGAKCNTCTNGQSLGPQGCSNESNSSSLSCANVSCAHGAICQLQNRLPRCICPFRCPHDDLSDPPQSVCGSDDQTYGSSCQLKAFACRTQLNMSIVFRGHCSSGEIKQEADEAEDAGSIGDSCAVDRDCLMANSVCYHGLCLCKTGFIPSDLKPFCRIEASTRPNDRRETGIIAFHIDLPSTSLQMEHISSPSASSLTTTSVFPHRYHRSRPHRNKRIGGDHKQLESSTLSSNYKTTPTSTTPELFTTASTRTIKLTTTSISPATSLPQEMPAGGASFVEKSYLQLHWSGSGEPNMSVEVIFIPQSPDGIIFYTGQLDNPRGDFVALTLRDGFVEFRYDLGSGPAVLKSREPVKTNQVNRVLGQRSSKDGSLKLNDLDEVVGTSKGILTMLNLDKSPIYLGSVHATKDVLLKHTGMAVGFVGCITSLRVSDSVSASRLYDLTYPGSSDVALGSVSGQHCSSLLKPDRSPCEPNPCEARGTCQRTASTDYKCICATGRMGKRCEQVSPVSFDDFTYHAYDNGITKPQYAQLSNKYGLIFRTKADRGLLLLLQNGTSIRADYLAIAINDGRVEASLNLGSEKPIRPFIIRSGKKINDAQWHTLIFSRNKTDVQLSVDSEAPTMAALSPGSSQLDTDGRLWIGGKAILPNGLPRPYLRGFKGCISSVKIDDRSLHLVDDRKTNNPLTFCEDQ